MALHRHTQHRHKVRGGGQHYKDVPHLMKAEHAAGKCIIDAEATMTKLEQAILSEISTLPEARLESVLAYIRFLKLGLADGAEIEKRFDRSWKRVRARSKKLKLTQADIEAEIRAVRTARAGKK